MNRISRRNFVELAVAAATGAPFVFARQSADAAAAITAQEVIDRIKKNVGVEWRPETVDTFKAGDPVTVVKGIVTTSMASMDVLRHAVNAGANLIITCGPTFYAKADIATSPAPGPVFAAKDAFIKKNNLVVWRFSDHWRLRRPDPLAQGLVNALGWSRDGAADDPIRVSIPTAITLRALSSEMKSKLNARGGIRVVGDPQTKVRTVGLLPGTTTIQAALRMLPAVDVIIAGEVREWESVEYARDKVASGEKKGLILLGRVLSEEHGMNVCAQWLKALVPERTTTWIRVGDPYWRPL
jgi:putative NIF3 family GTP cyclohydrolase 1 type 2